MDLELENGESWARDFREACRAQADRPGPFWAAQRARIRERIGTNRRASSLRLALVSLAALFVIASAMLLGGKTTVAGPQITNSRTISDQQLLSEIDETLTNATPDALAPMDLISQDMAKSLEAQNQQETR